MLSLPVDTILNFVYECYGIMLSNHAHLFIFTILWKFSLLFYLLAGNSLKFNSVERKPKSSQKSSLANGPKDQGSQIRECFTLGRLLLQFLHKLMYFLKYLTGLHLSTVYTLKSRSIGRGKFPKSVIEQF